MKQFGLPKKQGLYDPRFEHDACGMGFVVNIAGQKSHDIVEQAITILKNLNHRGASGSEENTGDGAGILLQIPHDFFYEQCKDLGFSLPSAGNYGVGMMFLPPSENARRECEEEFEKIVASEGQKVLGWRTVPVDPSSLGDAAKDAMPFIRQVFIERGNAWCLGADFERKLYVIRKRAENAIRYSGDERLEGFYVASLSCKTIVYKGMLTAPQLDLFYRELSDPRVTSCLAMVHSRFSTNTFPSWERAHPNRYIVHNGEINTIRGNVNRMSACKGKLKSDLYEGGINKIFPVINDDGSDSAMFDNALEFLVLSGRSLPHAVMMMIPEPWEKNESMSEEKRAFYEFHSCIMEPWDGPAAIGFTDGVQIGAVLDRNGLRPARYYITKDGRLIIASEVGVLDIEPENIKHKGRLRPGHMLLVDTEEGRIVSDGELKQRFASQYPYKKWLLRYLVDLERLPQPSSTIRPGGKPLAVRQKVFGYDYENIRMMIAPMAQTGIDPVGSMGTDIPLAVLSEKPRLLYDYFKQLFAQVTNPPIDGIREDIVISSDLYIGAKGNLINPQPEDCRQIRVHNPVITNDELERLRNIELEGFKAITLPILFNAHEKGGLESALIRLMAEADRAVEDGVNIIVLSDRGVDESHAPIPALLAVGGLHHHLVRNGIASSVSIVLESGEPREVHHFATLIGYGACAINPYLAIRTIGDLVQKGFIKTDYETAVKNYIKGAVKGILKVITKMGISTMQSYQGAQIFEALGLKKSLVDRFFTGTPSRIEGIGLAEIEKEVMLRHFAAFGDRASDSPELASGGLIQWRKNGEYHLFNPETIHKLQQAGRNNDYGLYKEYARLINGESRTLCTIRGLLDFKIDESRSVPLSEVEPVESICRRFKTGAMSYGSISGEAHEAIAIAMNRLGGKSNSGEGGEDPARFIPMENGDSKCSAIKQVASGRFGVTSNYLLNASEIQIKMAQGAKPGEGGQLPGEKVYPWIAKVRGATPGVGLISPPPHHDIYSIEDLAELIYDLKSANRQARINVKLVSEIGVGTVAAGVAKSHADVVLISGYDGGTGASPRTSIMNAGLPWEIGVAETHQTLLLNNLRDRIVIETDGKLLTGRDVVIAALLGAEEYGFATSVLILLGCVMMRVCHLDTCPVGVATQNPELRARFKGDPQYIINFMRFIAQDIREHMAMLGFRTMDEMIGRVGRLVPGKAVSHWKARGVDVSALLYMPAEPVGKSHRSEIHGYSLGYSFDVRNLLEPCKNAIKDGEKVLLNLEVKNTDRAVGTVLGSEVSKRHGLKALPDDTITLKLNGSAGQSLGAFVPKGITIELEGDANDYVGKGLSGGKLIIYPPKKSDFASEENIIIGNVALYGATGGEAYIRGIAGERFCVRNSGANAVVEGVGDHGCEYMTGGCVVVLGRSGRNFAAGMSGGIAFVLDTDGSFKDRCNLEMVVFEKLEDSAEIEKVKKMIENHVKYTNSDVGKRVLKNWDKTVSNFVKVFPTDYKRMLSNIERAYEQGLSGDDAMLAAFEANFSKEA
ncbi:MAG: Ferredoxin-dependent glutamate synthase 1 [Firmicutes bacterium ADurb.Bin193]|nr:MAG: Ferredoxin-dependent glutamate synthase 1 [Firmicutes bacterium ADurb.Bin193]